MLYIEYWSSPLPEGDVMSYVIETGYVINDDPMPINDEADQILHEAAAFVGASFIGSSLGLGTRDMHYEFSVGVGKDKAKAALSDFDTWVQERCPADAPYAFLKPVLSKQDYNIEIPNNGEQTTGYH